MGYLRRAGLNTGLTSIETLTTGRYPVTKGPYEATSIKDVDVEHLAETFDYERLQVGFDVAKDQHFVCLMGPHWEDYYIFRFDAREEMDRLTGLLEGLPADEIRCALEPTGTYGEPLRAELERHGFEVRQMNSKKCGQAQELFDDVPSLHDGKSAYLVARLSLMELSDAWEKRPDRDRKLRAILREYRDADTRIDRLTGRMEALLARFWPEVTVELDLRTATLQELIAEYGAASEVAADPEGVRETIRRVSRGNVGAERVETILELARETTGVEPTSREVEELKRVAGQMREAEAELRRCRRELEEVVDAAGEEDRDSEIGRLREFGGVQLAATLVGELGAPSEYDSAAAYEKAAGLNLKEKSSGHHQGQPRITKQGPGAVRHNLFLLACRRIQSGRWGCRYIRAWYQERLRRNGKVRLKALVAVMRKLIRALYHIGRGAVYDPHKLFDVSRLDVRPSTS